MRQIWVGNPCFIRLSSGILLLLLASFIFGIPFALAKAPSPSMPGSPPDPPMQVSAQASNHKITLTWTHTGNTARFIIYRSYVSGKDYERIGETAANSLTFIDSGLINRVTCFYVITALDNAGNESGYSTEVSEMPNPRVISTTYLTPTTISDYPISGSVPVIIPIQFELEDAQYPLESASWLLSQVKLGPSTQPPSAWTQAFPGRYIMSHDGNTLPFFQADVYPGHLTLGEEVYYVFCISTNAGQTWAYYGASGKIQNPNDPQIASNLGIITFTSETSKDLPTRPNLLQFQAGPNNISITWAASTDMDGLMGYDIYRADQPGETPRLIQRKLTDQLTTYNDQYLQPNHRYTYTIRAIDKYYQYSEPSQPIDPSTTDAAPANIILRVKVPAIPQGDVFINRVVDDRHLPAEANWQAQKMSCAWETLICSIHLMLQDYAIFPFKISRGNAGSVQTLPDGNTPAPDLSFQASNQWDPLIVEAAVYQWDDPLVIRYSPAGKFADYLQPITVVWNQSMPSTTTFVVEEKSGGQYTPVTGRFDFGDNRRTTVFTPQNPLKIGAVYRVIVKGQADMNGNMQQVPLEWEFTTVRSLLRLPVIFR